MRKIIDFHQHLAEPSYILTNVMVRYGIERSIVMPYELGSSKANQLLHEEMLNKRKSLTYMNTILKRLGDINEDVHDIVDGDSRFVYASWISPHCKKNYVPSSVKIVKIIPVLDHVEWSYFHKLYDLLSNTPQPIVMIHTGWGAMLDTDQVSSLIMLLNHFKDKTFVLAHMKEDTDEYNMNRKRLLGKFENVYCETSYGAGPHRIKQYVDLGFGDRLLFGSDFRFRYHEPTLKWFIHMIELADISESEKDAIFHGNATRLLDMHDLNYPRLKSGDS